jgi:D-xylose 1-dehydrogenase (NADP+, D-xylono-1,5-lactone-forming)
MASPYNPSTHLKWGILGTARINRSVIPAIKASSRSRLTGIASRTYKSAVSYAKDWDIPIAYGSYEALLEDEKIDVVYIPLPNSLHCEWTCKAVQAGKHVLCEKPLALSIEEVEAMAEAASKSNVVLAEAFMYRHHPQTLKVKELIDDGVIGEVSLIRGYFSVLLSREGDVRFDPKLGGGSLWDVGCYPLNFAQYIMGGEPIKVFGWQFMGNSEVDTIFVGQMEFRGNTFTQFDCSFQLPFRTGIEIVGRKGNIKLSKPFNPGINEEIILTRDNEVEVITVPGQGLYLGEIEDMANAILLGKPSRIPIADSRGNVKVIQSLYESAKRNEPVMLSG